MSLRPFHLAFPVHDLDAARTFYGELLGCPEGRSAPEWIDFDLYGHQIVAHLVPAKASDDSGANAVDGHDVPVPHFGVVLAMDDWQKLATGWAPPVPASTSSPMSASRESRASRPRCSSAIRQATPSR